MNGEAHELSCSLSYSVETEHVEPSSIKNVLQVDRKRFAVFQAVGVFFPSGRKGVSGFPLTCVAGAVGVSYWKCGSSN